MAEEPGRPEMVSPYLAGGTLLGSYQINSFLDRGGMAFVYEATDLRLNRQVALKVLAPELARGTDFRERFLRESRFAASLDHPNIVPIYEAGESGGLLYIAMRYVRGTNLDVLLAEEGPMQPGRLLAILTPVADALDTAHAAGLVHRDVKPANILLAIQRDGGTHVYLSDFGVTTQTSGLTKLTATGYLVGTMAYTAPEQIRGEPLDARSDIYALGCVTYQCLTGVSPFLREDQAALLWAHLSERPALLSTHRPAVRAADPVLAKVLAKVPDERYQSCREFVEDLTLVLSGGRHAEQNVAASRETVILAPRPLLTGGAVVTEPPGRHSTTPPPPVEVDPDETVRASTAALLADEPADDIPVRRHDGRRRTTLIAATVVLLVATAGLFAIPLATGNDTDAGGTLSLSLPPATTDTIVTGSETVQTSTTSTQESVTSTDSQPAGTATATGTSVVVQPALAVPVQLRTIPAGASPGSVTITPDGSHAYVTNKFVNTITVVDISTEVSETRTPLTQIQLPNQPRFIAFNAGGTKGYVSMYDGSTSSMSVLDIGSESPRVVEPPIPVSNDPWSLTMAPDGHSVWIPSHGDAKVDIVSVDEAHGKTSFEVAPLPHWVAFSKNGGTAYITNHDSDIVTVRDIRDMNNPKDLEPIPTPGHPHSVAISPDGTTGAVVSIHSNQLYFFDTTTNRRLGDPITVGNGPQQVVFSPDSRFVYTVNSQTDDTGLGSISVINVDTKQETKRVSVDSPTSIAITPDGTRAYVTNFGSDDPSNTQPRTLTVLQTA